MKTLFLLLFVWVSQDLIFTRVDAHTKKTPYVHRIYPKKSEIFVHKELHIDGNKFEGLSGNVPVTKPNERYTAFPSIESIPTPRAKRKIFDFELMNNLRRKRSLNDGKINENNRDAKPVTTSKAEQNINSNIQNTTLKANIDKDAKDVLLGKKKEEKDSQDKSLNLNVKTKSDKEVKPNKNETTTTKTENRIKGSLLKTEANRNFKNASSNLKVNDFTVNKSFDDGNIKLPTVNSSKINTAGTKTLLNNKKPKHSKKSKKTKKHSKKTKRVHKRGNKKPKKKSRKNKNNGVSKLNKQSKVQKERKTNKGSKGKKRVKSQSRNSNRPNKKPKTSHVKPKTTKYITNKLALRIKRSANFTEPNQTEKISNQDEQKMARQDLITDQLEIKEPKTNANANHSIEKEKSMNGLKKGVAMEEKLDIVEVSPKQKINGSSSDSDHITKTEEEGSNITEASRRLIAARDAQIEDYPYVVSIQKEGEHWCAGALLNQKLVITTANCVWKSTNGLSKMQVRCGSRFSHQGGQEARIQEVRRHPEWSVRRDPDKDVALLLLDRYIRFSDSVHAVDLPNRMMNPVFKDVWVTSWGAKRRDGVFHNIGNPLQVYHMRLIQRQECDNITRKYHVRVTENFICLAQEGNRGPCTRDTGAPAVSDGVLWGLASWSIRKLCGTKRFPAVFSYIASHSNMDFISNATTFLMSEHRRPPFLAEPHIHTDEHLKPHKHEAEKQNKRFEKAVDVAIVHK